MTGCVRNHSNHGIYIHSPDACHLPPIFPTPFPTFHHITQPLTSSFSFNDVKMDNSPLSRLPPNIQSYIIRLALSYRSPITLLSRIEAARRVEIPLFHHPGAVHHTCRDLRARYTKYFYEANHFHFTTADTLATVFSNFHVSVREIGMHNAKPAIIEAGGDRRLYPRN